jgi:hypothetical protein
MIGQIGKANLPRKDEENGPLFALCFGLRNPLRSRESVLEGCVFAFSPNTQAADTLNVLNAKARVKG